MEIMADATNVIAEGEVLQLMNAHDPDTTEQRYLEVIHRKTAQLFQAGAEVAAVLAGSTPRCSRRSPRYGRHLGTAYQLIDDVLDYRSNPAERGKNLGDDLAEGKPTLPLIHALRHGDKSQQRPFASPSRTADWRSSNLSLPLSSPPVDSSTRHGLRRVSRSAR